MTEPWFAFYSKTELLGFSALEHADESMGVRFGRFYPEPGYAVLQPVAKALTHNSVEWTDAARQPDRRRELEAQRSAAL